MAPKGLFIFLLTGFPLGAMRGESCATLGDSVIREGVRFRSCVSDLLCCHLGEAGTMIVWRSLLNLHAGQTVLGACNMVMIGCTKSGLIIPYCLELCSREFLPASPIASIGLALAGCHATLPPAAATNKVHYLVPRFLRERSFHCIF